MSPTKPSKPRVALAWYLDFLLFTGLHAPTARVLEQLGLSMDGAVVRLSAFVVVSLLVRKLWKVTPGEWALGISSTGVAPTIHRREAPWTIFAGTLLILEGSKNLVRWTQGLPPPPVLGDGMPDGVAYAAISVLGLLNVTGGMLVLRTDWRGAMASMAVLVIELGSSALNSDAFRTWAQRAVAARRTLQGLSIRDGEMEFMQRATTEVLPFVFLAGIVWLFMVARRFRTPGTAKQPGVAADKGP